MTTRIRMRGGGDYTTPESPEDVCKRFRRDWTCPALDAEGKTTYLVWNHVLLIENVSSSPSPSDPNEERDV